MASLSQLEVRTLVVIAPGWKEAQSFHRYPRSMQAFGIQEKMERYSPLRKDAELGLCTHFIFVTGELQKAMESAETFVWHPGIWTLWSLGAVGDEFSVWVFHLSSNSIYKNQRQPPSLHGFTKAPLGLRSTEWNLHWAKPSLTHNLMFFILQLDI